MYTAEMVKRYPDLVCRHCDEPWYQGAGGKVHRDGRRHCRLRDTVMFWGPVAGWGVAALIGFLIFVAFLSAVAAPIISNSN